MKIDIYNFEARLSKVELRIRNSSVPEESKKSIFEFETFCFASGLSIVRVEKYMNALKKLSGMLSMPLGNVEKNEMLQLVSKIERSSWSSWTKHDYKVCLKKFYAWSGKPDLISWIKAKNTNSHKLPEELLSPAEIEAMLAAALTVEDRALIFCLWESGCRIGEILSLQVKNCFFDSIGAKIIVEGKTGMRRVRLIDSASILDSCINGRSGSARVWDLTYGAASMRLRRIAKRALIQKRIYPHLFRHSRATFLASYLTEAQMCQYLGWVMGSGMFRVYVHMSGGDLDTALIRLTSRNGVQIPVKDLHAISGHISGSHPEQILC